MEEYLSYGDLKKSLEIIEKYFPLPQTIRLKGDHQIKLNRDGNVELLIWYESFDGEIRCQRLILEPHDMLSDALMINTRNHMRAMGEINEA